MELKEKRILITLSAAMLVLMGFLWWVVFFQTGADWWHFDVGERIDTPQLQKYLNPAGR